MFKKIWQLFQTNELSGQMSDFTSAHAIDSIQPHTDTAVKSSWAQINPASGLPMLDGGSMDIAGNPYGMDSSSHDMFGDTFSTNDMFNDSLSSSFSMFD